MRNRRFGDSGFIWRAFLVVLPVAILSAISLAYLQEDRAAAQREAAHFAQAAAPEMARRIARDAGGAFALHTLRGRIAQGHIASPRDYPRLPEPAPWPATDLPLAVSGNAAFRLLLLDAPGGGTRRLSERALQLSTRFPEVVTASGSPVADLALLLALRHGSQPPSTPLLEALAARMRDYPSFLTPELLLAAHQSAGRHPAAIQAVTALQEAWSRQEITLRLLGHLLAHPSPPGEWLALDGQEYLALFRPAADGYPVTFLPASLLQQTFQSVLAGERSQLPQYAGAIVELAGKRFASPGVSPATTVILASASAPGQIGAEYPILLHLVLANPETLYTPYRRRLGLTAGLVFCALVTALASLLSLWRAHCGQLRLNAMKSGFVSSVSHELRAPLAAIRLLAESLERGKITDEAKRRDYFHLIVQQCQRLSRLVENVLDFSRIDQGRKQYHFAPADPVSIARQTVTLMEPCAAERQVRLLLLDPPSYTAGPHPCWDIGAVEQSLVNLLDNAIKHSPSGKTVTLELESSLTLIRYWVQDEGEGIPAEAHARIFQRFYRHGSELRRETQGAGIGLSIVKHVAEAHGGRAVVRSAPGQGSRFGLELPREHP